MSYLLSENEKIELTF